MAWTSAHNGFRPAGPLAFAGSTATVVDRNIGPLPGALRGRGRRRRGRGRTRDNKRRGLVGKLGRELKSS